MTYYFNRANPNPLFSRLRRRPVSTVWPHTHYIVGVMLILGLGIEKNTANATDCIGTAAREGSEAAMLLVMAWPSKLSPLHELQFCEL